ncbi:MAG: hypothetical protein AAGD14_04980 [Planctomycetota bacterium]
MKLTIGADGSLKLPPEALEALGAEPGDTVKLNLDARQKRVRMERVSDDPWADAMREGPSKGFDDVLSDQQKREAEAKDLFDRKLRDSKTDDEKPDDDHDRWR